MTSPAVIAHRGFAGIAPENTIAAIKGAFAHPETAMVEIDVRPAADGTPVVFHHDRLEGRRNGRPITDGTGRLEETPLETITAAAVLESGQTVPTLADVLEVLPPTAALNIELKAPGTTDGLRPESALEDAVRADRQAAWTPMVERLVADCAAFDGELLFSSFYEGAIAALADCAPAYAAAPVVAHALEDGLEIARRYDCAAIHPPKDAIADTGLAAGPDGPLSGRDRPVDIVAKAHDAGRAVNVWTVETWDEFDQLAQAGVDGIIAEYPGLGSITTGKTASD